MKHIKKIVFVLAGCFLAVLFTAWGGFTYPLDIRDDLGHEIKILKKPLRVVSLVPSVTEIILKIGACDSLCGITCYSASTKETYGKKIVGGFFSPSIKAIEKIEPDLIFVSSIHQEVMEKFGKGRAILVNIETSSLADSFEDIVLVGRIFDHKKEAEKIVKEIKGQLLTIKNKLAEIPESGRQRVIRLMGRDHITAPGDDSFQNEMILAAGGIPPVFHKKGKVINITKDEWLDFNPQVIYGCGGDRKAAENILNRAGWRDVEAVKKKRIYYFPCALTCRASTNTGYFVSWLSSRIYFREFSKEETRLSEDCILRSRDIQLDLDYIKNAKIVYATNYDFLTKTLLIDFKKPLSIVSTLEGEREGITSTGNHYFPPPCWGIGHNKGLEGLRSSLYNVIKRSAKSSSFLFTGADMDNLSINHKKFKSMRVYALVTAGVKSNAVRMSADEGKYYEPGTINIIILTNMRLSARAMTRAVITATEAKTAALSDMDIRSASTPLRNQATGTGTDNIIVVQGSGVFIDNSGGHCKMGELIAGSVYQGVKDAVLNQNGIIFSRNLFQRFEDRRIGVFGLVSGLMCDCGGENSVLRKGVEEILMEKPYSGFLKASFAISDDYEKGLIDDLTEYKKWAEKISWDIAGKNTGPLKEFITSDELPIVIKIALNSIINGVCERVKAEERQNKGSVKAE